MSMSKPERLMAWADAMNQMGRPLLTALVTTFYNVTLLVALIMGKLDIQVFIAAVGPVNGMIVGYWFKARDAEHEIARIKEMSAGK